MKFFGYGFKELFDFKDTMFFGRFFKLFLPLTMQQALISALYLVDNLMIGRLGETEIAAVSVSNQLSFLLQIITFGATSGATILIAQFNGKGDAENVRKTTGLSLISAGILGVLMTLIALVTPRQFLRFFSDDPAVIELGIEYLRICGWGFLARTLSIAFANDIKSCGRVKLPLFTTGLGVIVNTVLNYALIFGKMGFEPMGVRGAAIATLISNFVDIGILAGVSLAVKDPVIGGDMFSFSRALVKRFTVTSFPVLLNETLWSTGMTLYFVFYGMIGTDALAAAQIYKTMDTIGLVVMIGAGGAASIIIGNCIGGGQTEKIKLYSTRFVLISLVFGIVTGLLLYTTTPLYLNFYNVSAAVKQQAAQLITIYCGCLWAYMVEHNMIIGILRPGGDTLYSGAVDVLSLWAVSLPMLYIVGVVMHQPLWLAFLAAQLGSVAKITAFGTRVFRWRWINDLTHLDEGGQEFA